MQNWSRYIFFLFYGRGRADLFRIDTNRYKRSSRYTNMGIVKRTSKQRNQRMHKKLYWNGSLEHNWTSDRNAHVTGAGKKKSGLWYNLMFRKIQSFLQFVLNFCIPLYVNELHYRMSLLKINCAVLIWFGGEKLLRCVYLTHLFRNLIPL